MKAITWVIGGAVAAFSLLGCGSQSNLAGKWVHAEKAITLTLFKSGDLTVFAPCYSNLPSGAGTFEFLDNENLKIGVAESAEIYNFAKGKNSLTISADSIDQPLVGEYLLEEAYVKRESEKSSLKSYELKYYYTERKVGDEYEYMGVPDDLGWNGTRLIDGAVQDRFHGCSGGFPLLDGEPIFDDKNQFYKDTYTEILNSRAKEGLHFLKHNDIDYGTLSFRFLIDGLDNSPSLKAQSEFSHKYLKGCRYTYGTPVVHQAKRSTIMLIPTRCGANANTLIYAKISESKSGLVSSRLRLIAPPDSSDYWRTDCTPSIYITNVTDTAVKLRRVLTTEYGQSFDSIADGECAPGVPENVEEFEIALK